MDANIGLPNVAFLAIYDLKVSNDKLNKSMCYLLLGLEHFCTSLFASYMHWSCNYTTQLSMNSKFISAKYHIFRTLVRNRCIGHRGKFGVKNTSFCLDSLHAMHSPDLATNPNVKTIKHSTA